MAISECKSGTDAQGRELLAHGTALFPAACYHDDITAEPVGWHWHGELEAAIVAEGSAVFATDRERVTLRAGDGCFLNAGVLHGAWNAGGGTCRLHSLVFHPKLVGGSAESVFWQRYLLPLTENPDLRLLPLAAETDAAQLGRIERAWRAGAEEPAGYEFTVRAELSQLILHLPDRPAGETRPRPKKDLREELRIKTMLAYIRAHLADGLTVRGIAASAALSESECLRCFRRTIGAAPIQYVKQLRLQKAAELLRETDETVAEIGALCGFQEMSYFARAFRAQYGRTPSAYRAYSSSSSASRSAASNSSVAPQFGQTTVPSSR